jgi:hypothetical protein
MVDEESGISIEEAVEGEPERKGISSDRTVVWQGSAGNRCPLPINPSRMSDIVLYPPDQGNVSSPSPVLPIVFPCTLFLSIASCSVLRQ